MEIYLREHLTLFRNKDQFEISSSVKATLTICWQQHLHKLHLKNEYRKIIDFKKVGIVEKMKEKL